MVIFTHIGNKRPKTSDNKKLPFVLAWKDYQGTFLHQARRAKVQESRQHETFYEIQ